LCTIGWICNWGGARVALLWQHNANPSSKLASIPRYDDIVRTAGCAGSARRRSSLAGDRRATGRAPNTARRIRQVGAAGPPATGRRRGAFSTLLRQSGIRAFHWWRSGNKKRTQNVSEYMLVLALCLVMSVMVPFGRCSWPTVSF